MARDGRIHAMHASEEAISGEVMPGDDPDAWQMAIQEAVERQEGARPGQLSLVLAAPDLLDTDAAKERLRYGMASATDLRRVARRRPGTVNAVTAEVRDDLMTAWRLLGGHKWIIACIASSDHELRSWALRMFEKLIARGTLTLGTETEDPAGNVSRQFVMVTTGGDAPDSGQ